jgi:hypothetical protein
MTIFDVQKGRGFFEIMLNTNIKSFNIGTVDRLFIIIT